MKKFLILLLILFASVVYAQSVSEAEKLYKQGYQMAVDGNLDGGMKLFEQAIAADKNFFMAHFDLGGIYEMKGDKDRALQEYILAAQIKPEFVEVAVEVGTILLIDKNQFDESLKYFRQALLVQSPYIDSRFSLASSLDQAVSNVAVAYAMKKEFGVAHSVAQSYLKYPNITGKADSQMNIMVRRTATDMNLNRQYAEILAPIGKLLYDGRPGEALKQYQDFEKAHTQLTPYDAWDLYSGIAMASADVKDYATSETYFAKAVSVTPPLPAKLQIESRFNLACTLSIEGKIDLALEQISQVLWLDFITRYDPDITTRKTPALKTDETLENVRKDSRFAEILKSYGL